MTLDILDDNNLLLEGVSLTYGTTSSKLEDSYGVLFQEPASLEEWDHGSLVISIICASIVGRRDIEDYPTETSTQGSFDTQTAKRIGCIHVRFGLNSPCLTTQEITSLRWEKRHIYLQ